MGGGERINENVPYSIQYLRLTYLSIHKPNILNYDHIYLEEDTQIPKSTQMQ